MILSKLNVDLSNAPWNAVSSTRTRAQQLFEVVTRKQEVSPLVTNTAERMTLGELLYRALVEPAELVEVAG